MTQRTRAERAQTGSAVQRRAVAAIADRDQALERVTTLEAWVRELARELDVHFSTEGPQDLGPIHLEIVKARATEALAALKAFRLVLAVQRAESTRCDLTALGDEQLRQRVFQLEEALDRCRARKTEG